MIDFGWHYLKLKYQKAFDFPKEWPMYTVHEGISAIWNILINWWEPIR
jgi:hypothetical protein